MKLESKYEMGQELFHIIQATVKLPPVQCDACDGNGDVRLRGETYACPNCNGRKQIQKTGHGWITSASGRVGKIDIEHFGLTKWTGETGYDFDDLELGTPITIVKYMLDSTGIGSGSVYSEPMLFPSREAAQAECDRRNGYDAREAA